MSFPVPLGLAPMEARSVETIPVGPQWQYEPKWDGFRCVAFRDGKKVEMRSKSGQSLGRYFPEVVAALAALPARKFVLDGELVVPAGAALSFDALLQRIHPASSRVRKLAAETPAWYVVFDLLAEGQRAWLREPLRERRLRLEEFAGKNFAAAPAIRLSPATTQLSRARKWFGSSGATLDGLMAKQREAKYAAGERTAMVKIKPQRTADCVIGGFRYAEKHRVVGSLLLGLYDAEGKLNHVGFCSGLKDGERVALTRRLERLVRAPGFTGRAPGGPSRWSTERSVEWQPLQPKMVVEVAFDQVTAARFRHGTRLLRWRPDKAPRQCRMEQLQQKSSRMLRWLKPVTARRGGA